MKEGCDIREATHVKVNGRYEKITTKWGVDNSGHLEPPSRGGFGVVTESGRRISMWDAELYGKEE